MHPAPASPSPQSSSWKPGWLVLPFLLLFYVQLAHHALWRDEINAWAIACVSTGIPDLLHRVHYEAHPALWYLILYGPSRLAHALWAFKLVEAAIATGIYLLLGFAAPFRRLELLLILGGYYVLFQYTVMCRMYGLELLFALLYVHFRMRHPAWTVRNTLWLGLMANVDLTGAILAGGLLLEYVLELALPQGATTVDNPRVGVRRAFRLRPCLAPLALFAAFMSVSLETLWPAKDISWGTTGRAFSQVFGIHHTIETILKWIAQPWYPGPIEQIGSWTSTPYLLFTVFAALLLPCLFAVFRAHRRLGLMMVAITVTGMLFTQLTNVAGVRHTGIVYIAFLVALWILRFRGMPVSPWIYPLLGLVAVFGVLALFEQWSHPFVDDDAAAHWIQTQPMQEPLLVAPDTNVVGVPERLQRSFYSLECACTDFVLTFRNNRDAFRLTTDVPPAVAEGLRRLQVQQALLLINRRLRPDEQQTLLERGVEALLATSFQAGRVADEHFFLYQITREPSPSK